MRGDCRQNHLREAICIGMKDGCIAIIATTALFVFFFYAWSASLVVVIEEAVGASMARMFVPTVLVAIMAYFRFLVVVRVVLVATAAHGTFSFPCLPMVQERTREGNQQEHNLHASSVFHFRIGMEFIVIL